METGRDPGPFTFYMAKKLEYGLKLVRDRAGIEKFPISGEAIIDMENFINGLIKKYYRDDCDNRLQEIMDKGGENPVE